MAASAAKPDVGDADGAPAPVASAPEPPNPAKAKGKAAADVIGGRFGKSGGALVQFILLTLMPGANLLSLSPILSSVFIVVMIVWIFAVFKLSKEFKIKSDENPEVQ